MPDPDSTSADVGAAPAPVAGTLAAIGDRFRRNWQGYLTEFRVWLIVAGVATLADMVTTIMFMRQLGPDMEVHPAVRLVSHVFGPYLGPMLGKAAQFAALLLVTVYLRPAARWLFAAVIVLYTGAAIYNLWV